MIPSEPDTDAAAISPAAGLADPSISERYRVVKTLAAGDQDTIFLCRRLDTGALVELRVISGALGADRLVSPAVRQQATVVARIASPGSGIAAVHECDRASNGELVLVMEHPDGPSLREVLRRDGTLSCGQALDLAIQIAQALERAHSIGLVHGGLRPENVFLVDSEQSVVLAHFGFDWLIQSRSADAGGNGAPRAEPSVYQAPEQAAGEAGQQSDIHALGVILYEMLAGAPPSAGLSAGRPEPLTSRRSDVSPRLGRIIMRALETEPARRTGDISSLCNDLWEEASAQSPEQQARSGAAAGRWLGRTQKPLAILGTVAAVAIGVAAALWFGPSRPAVSRSPIPAPRAAAPAAKPESPLPGEARSTASRAETASHGPSGAIAPALPGTRLAAPPAAAPTPSPVATPSPAPAAPPRPSLSSTPRPTATAGPTSGQAPSPSESSDGTAPTPVPSRSPASADRALGARDAARPTPVGVRPPARATPPAPLEPVAQVPRPAESIAPPAPDPPAPAPAAPAARAAETTAAPAAKAVTPPAQPGSRADEDPGAIIDWLLRERSAPSR